MSCDNRLVFFSETGRSVSLTMAEGKELPEMFKPLLDVFEFVSGDKTLTFKCNLCKNKYSADKTSTANLKAHVKVSDRLFAHSLIVELNYMTFASHVDMLYFYFDSPEIIGLYCTSNEYRLLYGAMSEWCPGR